ncbi:MAG: hypothetical protein ACT4N9_08480 [Paracoccaceae bacterium]
MRISEAFQAALAATPGVDLLSYDDLSSGLALTACGRGSCGREELDRLAARAVEGFALVAGTPLPPGVDAGAFGSCLIGFGPGGAEVYARSPAAPGEAVSARCVPGTPLLPSVRAVLGLAFRLAEGE